MVGGRKQVATRVANDGAPARPGVKKNYFNMLEEEQLCIFVFFIWHDGIGGKSTKSMCFLEAILQTLR